MDDSVDKMIHALVTDPHRMGWRGNTTAWAKRAKRALDDVHLQQTAANRQRIAACIQDVRLLRPDLVKHCPAHCQTAWDPLYADVCHIVVTLKSETLPMVAWVGALAYYVHHHPQMGAKRINAIVSPGPDALDVALTNGVWGDTHNTPLPTRTVMVLLGATLTQFGPGNVVSTAVAWLQDRPATHFCDRMINALPPIIGMALHHKRRHAVPNNDDGTSNASDMTHHGVHNDIFGSTSLRMFGSEYCPDDDEAH